MSAGDSGRPADEGDYPADARHKPKVVRSLFEHIDPPLSSGEISQIIGQRLQEGLGIYEVDLEALQAAEPDLLLSQAICEVCAISSRQVTECSLRLAKTPQILSLDPQYVGDVLNDIRRVAAATGTGARGEEIVAGLQCPHCRRGGARGAGDDAPSRAAISSGPSRSSGGSVAGWHHPLVVWLTRGDPCRVLRCGGHDQQDADRSRHTPCSSVARSHASHHHGSQSA